LRIRILTVGRPRDAAMRDLCEAYLRRAGPFFRTTWDSVADGDPRGSKLPLRAVAAEGTRLVQRLERVDLNVALHERGKQRTSRELARWLGDLRDQGRAVTFVIGGAHGLSGDVLSSCNARLALSGLTLPHDLALLTLCEQVYRCRAILLGEPYHHG
jgi:23S rRNA (pseudouridine1915-N3)-methyltransferase